MALPARTNQVVVVFSLEDSSTYQLVLRRGQILALQDVILHQGGVLFGRASAELEAEIRNIRDLDRLRAIALRGLKAMSWDDLLAVPDVTFIAQPAEPSCEQSQS